MATPPNYRFELPENPTLAGVAAAYRDAGLWCHVVDDRWRPVYMTDDAAATTPEWVET